MLFTDSLKKNRQFRAVYSKGRSHAGGLFVVYAARNSAGLNHLGLSVSKKVGKAVCRNRVRRLIRESYRALEGRLTPGYDIVVVARAAAADVSLNACLEALSALFYRHKMFKTND